MAGDQVVTENISHIKNISKVLYWTLSIAMVVLPLYYLIFWIAFNYFTHTLFTISIHGELLVSEPLHPLQQLLGIGIASSLLVVLYLSGTVFSARHIICSEENQLTI